MEFNKKYEKQMISVDINIFKIIDYKLNVLLVKRVNEPYKNMWNLIGGGVYNDETCENAAKRELQEKLNLTNISFSLSNVFSDPKRDIRFRNISISYYCLIENDINYKINLSKVSEVKWFPIDNLPQLAFDHEKICIDALAKLKSRVYDINYMKSYFPKNFTLSSLQLIYESILQTHLDKRNFRRKLASLNCLINTGKKCELDKYKKSYIYKFK